MIRQNEALEIGNALLAKHNLNEWKIQFNKSPSKLGQCWFQQKVIAISVFLLNSTEEEEYKDTILHEIAHALVGPEAGHGPIWQSKAQEIGSTGKITGLQYVDKARSVTAAEQVAKKHISPLTKKCPICNATAIEKSRAKFGEKTFIKLECGHMVKKEELEQSSFESWTSQAGKALRPYQVEGARFIEKANGRALIADEPGLGKTAQALSFLKFHKDIALPCLWICKTTLKIQALKEAVDWCGNEYLPFIISSSKSYILPGFKIYVISMDLLRNIKLDKLEALGIKTIVFDEVQHIKNPDSARTQEVRRLVNGADFFIGLSGTPWKNRGSEYFSVLNMLAPERFPSYQHFKNKWVDINYDSKSGKFKEGGIRNIPEFKRYTSDFVIRRMRDEVLPDLPKINRTIRYVELEDIYGEQYEKAEEHVATIIKDLMLSGDEAKNTQLIATEIMKLKHITGLAKVDAQYEDAKAFLEDTEDWEKITLFHHHIDVGDRLEAKVNQWLVENGYERCCRLTGGMDAFRRNDIVERFKNDIKSRVLIASTLASGEGLNLQFCQNASMMERQWNPQNEEQAELRFSRPLNKSDLPEYLWHLIDRKVSISIPYLICANTVDELLTNIVEWKRTNYNRLMTPGMEELKFSDSEMIRELAEAIVRKKYGKKAS